jgi:hypothetical protein
MLLLLLHQVTLFNADAIMIHNQQLHNHFGVPMKMRNLFLYTFILLASYASESLLAQTFSMINVDASKFPLIRTRFLALNEVGKEYQNLVPADFVVTENGTPVNASVRIDCIPSTEPPTANVVVILDRSQSMETLIPPLNEKRWDWVKQGATDFINQFPFNPPSEMALISFATLPVFEQNFTNNRGTLINAVNKIKLQGTTVYEKPILDSSFGAVRLLVDKRPQLRRVIVFLTDGVPDNPPPTNKILDSLRAYGITFYAITVGMPMNDDLATIASGSGGKSFSADTKEKLSDIYKTIALEISSSNDCYIEYTAPFGCGEASRLRRIDARFRRSTPPVSAFTTYTAPAQSVAQVIVSDPTLDLGDPAPNTSSTKQLSITARRSPFRIEGANIVPVGSYTISNMDGRTFPFTLDTGQTWKPTIQFNQGNVKQFKQATLLFTGSPCPPSVALVGGRTNVFIINPNDTATYSLCDTVDIKWAGVEPNQPINIFYTADGNNANPQWVLVERGVSGLSYRWKPPVPGNTFRIRVELAQKQEYKWVQSLGGKGRDTCNSITIDPQELYTYVGGGFSDTVNFSPSTRIGTQGGLDGFVSKFDTDGNHQWTVGMGGTADDQVSGVATLDNNGVYAAGQFTSRNATFGGTPLTMQTLDVRNIFLTYVDKDANISWVRYSTGSSSLGCFARVENIGIVASTKQVVVRGRYNGRISFSGSTSTLSRTPMGINQQTYPFLAVFNRDGTLASLSESSTVVAVFSAPTINDSKGNTYSTGTYSGTLSSPPLSSNSIGSTDVFVRKFGGTPGSSDSSEKVFRVVAPIITFTVNKLTFTPISQGQTRNQTFTAVLKNTSDLPVILSNSTITGVNASDFKFATGIANRVLLPGETMTIELNFTPSAVSNQIAVLTINGNCNSSAQVALEGEGLIPCKFDMPSSFFVGSSSQNVKISKTEPCMIRNSSNQSWNGNLTLQGTNADEFEITIPSTSCVIRSVNSISTTCPFGLGGGECLKDLNISFTPKGPGVRTAQLVVDVCGSPQQITLIGNAVSPIIEVTPLDWGLVRRNRSVTRQVTITNTNDSLPAIIDSISLSIPNDVNYSLGGNVPAKGSILGAKRSETFDVTYSPTTEDIHLNFVAVYSSGNTSPATGSLKGRGYVPDIVGAGVNFDKTPINTQSTQNLSVVISNPDTVVPLTIRSISLPNPTVFGFVPGTQTANIIVQPKDSIRIGMTFLPTNPRVYIESLFVVNDSKDGNDSIVTTEIPLRGEGISLAGGDIISFGNILLCDTNQTIDASITNPSASDLEVDYSFTDADSSAFELIPPTRKIIISGLGEFKFKIRFKPTLAKGYSSVLTFNNPVKPIVYQLNGTATTATLDLSASKTLRFDIGSRLPVTISAKTPDLGDVKISKLELGVSYDSKALLTYDTTFTNNNWNWVVKRLNDKDSLYITGTTSTNPLVGNTTTDLFNIIYLLNLTSSPKLPIVLNWINRNDYNCLVPNYSNGEVNVTIACFSSGRAVTFSNVQYMLAVNPNPSNSNTINLQYNLALNTSYSVEIFNMLGEKVLTVDSGSNAKEGTYNTSIDASALSNGTYYVKMVAGPFTDTKQLILNR